MFDTDGDGRLSESELAAALQLMQTIQEDNAPMSTPPGTPPLSHVVSNGTPSASVNGVGSLDAMDQSSASQSVDVDQKDGRGKTQDTKTKVEEDRGEDDNDEDEDDDDDDDDDDDEDMDSSGVFEETGPILSQYAKESVRL